MYYCTDCGAITEGTTETETVLESIPGIQRGASQWVVKCSNCGSYDIEDAIRCKACGEWIEDTGIDYCEGDMNILYGMFRSIYDKVGELYPDMEHGEKMDFIGTGIEKWLDQNI